MADKKVYKGLKMLRSSRDPKPTYKCENCKCMRYSPCGCTEKKSKK